MKIIKQTICDKYKAKTNKSYEFAIIILETILSKGHIDKSIDSKMFSSFTYFKDHNDSANIQDDFDELKYMHKEPLRLLRCLSLLENEKKNYELPIKKWLEPIKYKIDTKIIKELVPILLGYIGKIPDSNIHNFFKKIDKVLNYGMKPSVNHNSNSTIEEHILNAINNLEEINIYKKDDNAIIIIASEPIEIIYRIDDSGNYVKYLIYVDAESINSVKYEIKFSDIVNVSDAEMNEAEYNNSVGENEGNYNLYSHNSNYLIDSNEDINDSEPIINVKLEVDTLVSEFLSIEPLNNMVIYRTQKEKDIFFKNQEQQPLKNKIYVEASDNKEYIIDFIFKNIQYVKILDPISLNDEIQDRFNTFIERMNNKPRKSPKPLDSDGPINSDKKIEKEDLQKPDSVKDETSPSSKKEHKIDIKNIKKDLNKPLDELN